VRREERREREYGGGGERKVNLACDTGFLFPVAVVSFSRSSEYLA
jgi:hypothetical protein